MKTHDETLAHKKAIALAFAEDPTSILFDGYPPTRLSGLHIEPWAYSIKPKPAIAPGHNPDGLTVEQVGEGWRLLEKDEIKGRNKHEVKHLELWDCQNRKWITGDVRGCNGSNTYRTRLSREQLALLDKNEGWIPWFGGECPVEEHTMVEIQQRHGQPFVIAAGKKQWCKFQAQYDQYDIIAYRPAKTEPKVVPWDCAADVPGPVCWVRAGTAIGGLVIGIMKEGIIGASYPANLLHTWEAIGNAHTEYSTDRINWFPCNKKEETK